MQRLKFSSRRVWTLSTLFILLTGCSSVPIQVQNPFVMPDTVEVVIHPEFPDPLPPFLKGRIQSIQVKDEDGNIETILGFSPQDSQLFRLWEEQRELRTEKLINMVCFYRKELEAPKDKRCPDEESN